MLIVYKIWSDSFLLLSLGLSPGIYPLLLMFLDPFLPPRKKLVMWSILTEEEMNQTISCKLMARMTTPQTLKIEGHIEKKNVQEVKDHIKKEEMNPTISCNSLVGITTPQTIKIEGHIKKKNVQEVKDHIEH